MIFYNIIDCIIFKGVFMKNKFISISLLLITSIIWGTSFIAQIVGMDHIGPFTFTFTRNVISTLFLLLIIPFLAKINSKDQSNIELKKNDLVIGGVVCGAILFIASSLQQIGLQYTTAGKGGFITTLYIVIVPMLGLFFKKRVSLKVWLCIFVAAVGMYLLSIKGESFTIEKGDFLVFLCAIAYSFHILAIDYFSPKTDGTKLSCIQFFVCGALAMIAMFMFETFDLQAILKAIVPILYAGVFSSGIGYTLQILAQKNVDPTTASLILSLESVFAVLSGIVLLNEVLTTRELIGCILIFIAVIVTQIPDKKTEAV